LVAREARKLHEEFGVNYLYFTDLTFNDDADKLKEICWALIDEGLHEGEETDRSHLRDAVHWYALLKVGLDDETAKLMSRAGCSKVGVGVESFDAAQVQRYRKPYEGTSILDKSLTAADNAGIIIRCLLVIGSSTETPDTVSRTINNLKHLPVDQVRLAFLTPYPNTPIYHSLSSRLTTRDLDLYDEDHPIVRCDALSARDLCEARSRIVQDFYGSNQYRLRCKNKIKRFPWLKESYEWFFRDLYNRSAQSIDLRSLTSQFSIPLRRLRYEEKVSC
jgi:radical SAM superfamily enzyme YgiQ (UPF0313 family)